MRCQFGFETSLTIEVRRAYVTLPQLIIAREQDTVSGYIGLIFQKNDIPDL
jgi:hypothetical protein